MVGRVDVVTRDRPVWRLSKAVLVYEGPESGAYATLHDVLAGKGGARLDAGVPATKEACASLARALGANATLTGFTPPELVYLGARAIAWWRPPAPARLFFDSRDEDPKRAIGKRNALLPQPGLVFAVTAGHWYVYALRGAARPDPATRLCRAPYFNVWASGEICTGNVRLPDSLSPAALAAYERAFFDSNFTHPNVRGRERLVRAKGGAYAFWRGMLDRAAAAGNQPFPPQALVPLKLTLSGLATRLEKGEHDGRD